MNCYLPLPMHPELEQFLANDLARISIGYQEIEVANSTTFNAFQHGYRINPVKKKSLIGKKSGDWKESWFVVASIEGDPVFFQETDLAVYTAMHGQGEWEESKVCTSLGALTSLLNQLKKISINRESPVALEKNPITRNELKEYFKLVSQKSDNRGFWELFVDTFE